MADDDKKTTKKRSGFSTKEVKKEVSKALSKANEKRKELLAEGKEKLGEVNKRLRESKHRRMIDGGEVLIGGIAGGALAGAGISINGGKDADPDMPEIPASVPGGIGLLLGGLAAKSYDLQATGLGMLTFGAGRMVEDFVADKMDELNAT